MEKECQSPLSGYRVLEMSPLIAGSICGMLLADLGADVIKLEPPVEGDPARHTGIHYIDGESVVFLSANRNKRSLTLDLKKEEGREAFYRLLSTVDVVIEGFGPGEALTIKVDYNTCRKIREDIIYLSLSGFGQTGPYAHRPANDPIIQAVSGLMSLTGELGGPPLKVGNQASDFGGASLGAFAVCTALFNRERTGQGQNVHVSLLDAMIYSLIPREGEVLATGKELVRYGTGHPSFVPYQTFEAQDGKWLFLSCFTQKFWSNLCHAIGRPDLENDPRFATNPDRVKNRHELISVLEELFKHKPMADWIDCIQKADIPCGPVNDLAMAMDDPQVVHNQMFVDMDHPNVGKFRTVAQPVRFLETPPRYELPPPSLGQHSNEILQELGFGSNEIQRLKQQKVI